MSKKRNHVIQKQNKVIQGKLTAHRETKKGRGNRELKDGETTNSAFGQEQKRLSKRELVFQEKCKHIQEKLKAWKKMRNLKVQNGETKNPAFEPCFSIFKNVNEDILFEIFLRLPEYRSVVFCGAVCPQWHSVISQPKFVPDFVHHHHHHVGCNNSRPYTVIFSLADIVRFHSIECYQPFLTLQSEESLFLHGRKPFGEPFGDWDFMPSSMIVRASLDDLLLVSPDRCLDYYICNPLSKQWVQLPRSRGTTPCGFALVRKLDQYKVVLIHFPGYPTPDEENQIATSAARVFCSLSGKWTLSKFSYPPPKDLSFNDQFDVVTRNSVLYWLETKRTTPDRVLFFDVFNDQWGIIDFPVDLVVWGNSYGKVYLGLVCGEVRLVQIVKRCKSCFVIKIWELHADSSCWLLIKEAFLTRPNTKKLRGFAVHPYDGDLVFLIWGRHAFEHKISRDTCLKVGDLPFSVKDHQRVVSIPILHPPVPTPVPLLPKCTSGTVPCFFT